MIIAIDGPAAAGKGTLAKKLAEKFDFAYLDTGSLYRAVALMILNAHKAPEDKIAAIAASATLDVALLNSPNLRTERTAEAAALVAAIPEVRHNLLKFQQNFANNPPNGKAGAVIDGRDIGTVVCPKADVKLFITASAEERAKRRTKELLEKGIEAEFDEILADVLARDARDTNRNISPLRPAENAHLLDTTKLDIDAVFLKAVAIVEKAH